MPNLLARLTEDDRSRLIEELNYLNLQEIRSFCAPRGIPYKIVAQHSNSSLRTTKDADRKPVVLERIRRFLMTGEAGQPTCIQRSIVRKDGPPVKPNPRDRLYYRWYAKKHTGVLQVLNELTDGRFADGAVARVLIMDFWARGEAPTLLEFARAWTKAKTDEHKLLTPEYAYLSDLKHKQAGSDWKSLRTAKAQSALRILERISPVPAESAGR